MQIAIAQQNFLVGDVQGNTQKVLDTLRRLQSESVDIIVFPELTLTGYPPEDLLLKPELYRRVEFAMEALVQATRGQPIAILVGYPLKEGSNTYNALSMLASGKILATHRKQALPNYSVFDEQRYFSAGEKATVVHYQGKKIALQICEDLWESKLCEELQLEQPDLLLVCNASPYHLGHHQNRNELLQQRSQKLSCPIIYANLIGGQDELVFDGASMIFDAQGDKVGELPQFEESINVLSWSDTDLTLSKNLLPIKSLQQELIADDKNLQQLYQALVLGVRDYVGKNGFKGAVIGLSGGIDSALTLAIAVDALGAENVTAIMMPFRYTSTMSLEDAQQQATTLGVRYEVISIEPIYEQFMQQLSPIFKDTKVDTTEENLQSRCRGVILMAYSNKFGHMVLTTGNKSEMAVGYATLYGDMAGGFGVLKDVFKMSVFELSRYRNRLHTIIPERVISRPPSAELAPDQIDEDSLPPYEILDAILMAYIENENSFDEIVAMGHAEEVVSRVLNLVDINEHKRRQAPPGVRVTKRAFGRDHRYPITSAYRKQPRLEKQQDKL